METEERTKNLSSYIIDALHMRSMTVEKLAQITGISDRFIALLLEEKFNRLPAAPYVHGYLIKIADALGLQGEALWQEYLHNEEMLHRAGSRDTLPNTTSQLVPWYRTKIIFILGFCALLIALYGTMRYSAIIGRPSLTLHNLPDDTLIATTSLFSLYGTIHGSDQITLNGEVLYPDTKGVFTKDITLQPGFTTLTFRTKRFLGKEYVVIKQIFYSTSESELSSQNTTYGTTTQETEGGEDGE